MQPLYAPPRRGLAASALWIAVGALLTLTPKAFAQSTNYAFLEGYNVLDEANAPGIGTNLAATAGLKYGGFGVDVANGIIYLTRDASGTEDGRTNATKGLVAVITTTNGFGGGNYTDTGLLASEPGSQPIFASHGAVAMDPVNNRFFVLGNGTNAFDFRGAVFTGALGTLGGEPAGGNPGAANLALTNVFQTPSDLTNQNGTDRAGTPRSLAVRTADGVTTVFLAVGNHVQAWRNDATNGSPQFPWRRLWATLRAPRQDSVALRLTTSDQLVNGIDADDAGNCYFAIGFTYPPRIWRVPANAAEIAPDPFNLDFDDRAVGGFNSTSNTIIIPVLTRLPSPAMTFDGTNSFVNPGDITFFRTEGRPGLFVSSLLWMNDFESAHTPYRAVARLVLEPPTTTEAGHPYQAAALVDAFGSSAVPDGQDTTLSTTRSSFNSLAFGLSQPMKYVVGERLWTQVDSVTNPSVLYFQAYLTDTNKGQTIPTAAIAKASIPPLPPPPAPIALTPAHGLQDGGTLVELSGSNFVAGAQVWFGDTQSASVNFSNATLLTAIAPAHAAGPVAVLIRNPDGQQALLGSAFSYIAPFNILSVTALDATTVGITWEAIPELVYEVQVRDTLAPTNWTTLGSITAATTTASFTNAGLGDLPQRYFRVMVSQ